MLTGTNYFVSFADAMRYYAAYGPHSGTRDAVTAKLMAGEIALGKPPGLKDGELLVTVDDGARYAVRSAAPTVKAVSSC